MHVLVFKVFVIHTSVHLLGKRHGKEFNHVFCIWNGSWNGLRWHQYSSVKRRFEWFLSTIIIDHDVSRIIDLCFPSIAAMKIWVGDLNKEEKKKCIFRYLLWKWSIYFERLNNNISYGFNILYVLIRHTTELQTLNKMKFTAILFGYKGNTGCRKRKKKKYFCVKLWIKEWIKYECVKCVINNYIYIYIIFYHVN